MRRESATTNSMTGLPTVGRQLAKPVFQVNIRVFGFY